MVLLCLPTARQIVRMHTTRAGGRFPFMYCFYNACFNGPFFLQEMDLIREQVQKLISLPMWICLLPVRCFIDMRTIFSFLNRLF